MVFLYYDIGEVKMEFFRQNQKIIVGIIVVSFVLWTMSLMLLPLFLGAGR